jgi:3'(2'), 5'-bisphosphate nucleotidase
MSYLDQTSLHILLNKLFPIIKEAGNGILSIYNTPFDVILKSNKTPLTEADQTSNKIICDALQLISPNIPIISEESINDDYEKRGNYDYCWIIDPLDGTKEFIKKNDEFAINIALCYKNEIILGMVHSPVFNKTAWAVKGSGAYLINECGMICRLHCDTFTMDQINVRVLTSRSHISDKVQHYISQLNDPILKPCGSSWKFVMIANNEADYYPRPGTTMEWDTAAPHIIIEEAGGSIYRLDNCEALTYNKENLRNPDFAAIGLIKETNK